MPFDLPVPIAMIVVGTQYLEESDCKFSNAPYYLLLAGCTYTSLAVLRYALVFCCKTVDLKKKDRGTGVLFVVEVIANLSTLVWGTVSVSGELYQP